jgi:hypothetical protein
VIDDVKPSFRDYFYSEWATIALLIQQGGTPERKHVEALLRSQPIPIKVGGVNVGEIIQSWLADTMYGRRGRGAPKKTKLRAESEKWARAERLISQVETFRRSDGLSFEKACAAAARGNTTGKSIERQYWAACEVVKHRRSEFDTMIVQAERTAALLFGTSKAEFADQLQRFTERYTQHDQHLAPETRVHRPPEK